MARNGRAAGHGGTSVPAGPRVVVRKDSGLYAYERALSRAGLTPVAGVDEAGRGACAGPLVVAAVILPEGRRGQVPGLADSKLLTPTARDEVYAEVLARALCWSAVVVPAAEVDRIGLHVCNVEGMRRALCRLERAPSYVLTDGFPVAGLPAPGLAVWKGDRVSASIAAASVVAKVTRDRLMLDVHNRHPAYDFAGHKGYVTPTHNAALEEHGPCPEHRFSFVNVASRCPGDARIPSRTVARLDALGGGMDGAPVDGIDVAPGDDGDDSQVTRLAEEVVFA
jgi:ribonuclease HII